MADDSLRFQSPRPLKTSTPATAKLPRAVLDSDLSSGGEDFVSPPSFHQKGAAGSTPFNHHKPSFYSISFSTPSSAKHPNGTTVKELETILEEQQRKMRLFGTAHIKSLAAIFTFIEIYLYGTIDETMLKDIVAPNLDYIVILSLLTILAIMFLSLGGLYLNKAWMLLPTILLHVTLVCLIFLGTCCIVAAKIFDVEMPFRSPALTIINSVTTMFFFVYATAILIWCYSIIKKEIATLPILNVINDNFEAYGSQTLQSIVDKEDDVILFDSVKTNPRKLTASPGPSGRRHVRFMDV